jgi:hypothetical protein
MGLRLSFVVGLVVGMLSTGLVQAVPESAPTAELIYFTVDGTETGTPLMPGFLNDSVWSGLGVASNGRVYVAVSNHLSIGGNVAIYRYDPATSETALLGDIKSISSAAGNWMPNESQRKVHTFLAQHADGFLYFASDEYEPTPLLRGSHLYRLDPTTETIEDYSRTTPYLMKSDLSVVANTGQNLLGSGIFIEEYGIKGIGLNPSAPDLLYAMTYPDGHLIKFRLSDGSMEVVGQSERVSYVFYVSDAGDVYYTDVDETSQTLYKYDESSDSTSIIAADLPGAPNGEIGSIAPQSDGHYVYFLLAGAKQIYRLDTLLDQFSYFSSACGSNWWRLYNLHLSADEQSLYFVSNNNDRSTIRRIDVATQDCSEILDVDGLLGSRNLSFGGTGVWDAAGHFYAPVWTLSSSPPDTALLKVDVEVPEPGFAWILGTGTLLLGFFKTRRERRDRRLR